MPEAKIGAYHDAEAETEGACKENITLLDAKVALARKQTDDCVDTDDSGAEDAGCTMSAFRIMGLQEAARLTDAADNAHDPSPGVIVESTGCQLHDDRQGHNPPQPPRSKKYVRGCWSRSCVRRSDRTNSWMTTDGEHRLRTMMS